VCSLFDVTCSGLSSRPCRQKFAAVNVTCFSLNSQPHQDKSGPNRSFTRFQKRVNPCTSKCLSDILRRDAVAIRPRSRNSSGPAKSYSSTTWIAFKIFSTGRSIRNIHPWAICAPPIGFYQSLLPTALSFAMQEENDLFSSCWSRSNSMSVHYTFGRAECLTVAERSVYVGA
jgi:hypothetical protein